MIQPSWMTTFSNDQVSFGFDEKGLWFVNNADGTTYPVRTNFNISQDQTTTIIFTFIHDSFCSDQGVCVFNNNTAPIWEWNTDMSRIAFSMNCPGPYRVGFDADSDGTLENQNPPYPKSYFTFISKMEHPSTLTLLFSY